MNRFTRAIKRTLSGFTLSVHLFVTVMSSLVFPLGVNAQVATASVTTADVPRIAAQIIIEALSQVGAAIQVTAAEVLTYLGQKVAHDAALHLVAGASGQKPLFSAQDAGTYALDLGKDLAAQSLSGFVENLTGLNICTFDPTITLNLQLQFADSFGLFGPTGGPQGRKCDYKALSQKWDQVSRQAETFAADPTQSFSARFQVQFRPGNSSLDGLSRSVFGMIEQVQQKRQALMTMQTWDRIGTIMPKKDPITGKVLTPKELNAEYAKEKIISKPARDIEQKMNAALQADAKQIVKIVALSAQVFVQTLLGEISKKIIGGLTPEAVTELENPFAPSTTGLAEARTALRSLLVVNPGAVAQYDVLGLYASCPTGAGTQRNPDNCVADQQLATAVRRGGTEASMTLRQAMDQGLLHGNWELVGPYDPRNQQVDCYLKAYCYSNIVKLRRARVLPVGFELAALKAGEERPGTTLQEVVNAYEGSSLPSFRHLIDPNWILKYPPTQCRQMVNGVTLLSDQTPNRHEICVDTPSCISEDGNGNCVGPYGYCTKEKNVWRLDGDSCPKEMASCLTFTRSDSAAVSYLTNTVDASGCDSNNPGCWRYLLNADPSETGDRVAAATSGTASNKVKLSAAVPIDVGNQVRIGVKKDLYTVIAKTMDDHINLSGVITLDRNADWQANDAVVEYGYSNLIGTGIQSNAQCAGAQLCTTQVVKVTSATGFTRGNWVRINGVDAVIDSIDLAAGTLTVHAKMSTDTTSPVQVSYGNGAVVREMHPVTLDTPSVYLNKKIQTCASGDAGCTELIDLTTNNTPVNIIRNPSFESDSDGNGLPDAWFGTQVETYDTSSTNGRNNTSAVRLPNSSALLGHTIYQYVKTAPTKNYILSFYARNYVPGEASVVTAKVTYYSVDSTTSISTDTKTFIANADTFHRSIWNFVSPTTNAIAKIEFTSSGSAALGASWIDDVQLEESEIPTIFHEGYASGTSTVMMKTPPVALGCDGSANQPAACSKYAGVCSPLDVGCEKYTPTNGDPSVNGRISRIDLCPNSCIGYDTFKELGYEDSEVKGFGFELSKFPVYTSPTFPGAQQCRLQSVGCSEFTNMESATAGGEAKEYFSKFQLCSSDQTQAGTFYTWEGSDVAGLQLKTWRLMKSNNDSGLAPCTNGSWVGDGDAAVFSCQDTISDVTVDADQPNCNELEDITVRRNPECRMFYDEAGGTHFRLLPKTITVSDACTRYRKTYTGIDSLVAGTVSRNNCNATGGRAYPATGNCIYYALKTGSISCTAEENNCRAYRGNAGANTRLVVAENFEGTTNGWSATQSSESIASGGKSIKSNSGVIESKPAVSGIQYPLSSVAGGSTIVTSFWAKGDGAARTVNITFSPAGSATSAQVNLTNDWQRYTLNSMALPNIDANQAFVIKFDSTGGDFFVDNFEIRSVTGVVALVRDSWTVPAECNKTLEGADSPQEMLGCREYRDRAGRSVALRSFSRQCGDSAVGCKAFSDTKNSSSPYAQIFNARCYANTQGTALATATPCRVQLSGGSELEVCTILPNKTFCRFNSTEELTLRSDDQKASLPNLAVRAADTVVVGRDETRFLIDDPGMRCAPAAKGCYEFGKVIYSQDQKYAQNVSKTTLLNLPDNYATQLCGEEGLFCDAFNGADNSTRYFRDPAPKNPDGSQAEPKTCEYRDEVIVGGNKFSGWFKKGKDEPCYPDFLVSGSVYGLRRNADPSFEGWVGECPGGMSKCTEFVDPTDISDAHPEGQSYYFLKNQRMLSNTCSQGSRREACALFNDTSDPTKRWNTEATYVTSDGRGGELTTPISCEGAGTSPSVCANRCLLSFIDLNGEEEPTKFVSAHVCQPRTNGDPVDADCAGVKITGKRISSATCVSIANPTALGNVVFENTRDSNVATASKPVSDSNIILKVRRDRECGEWLTCTTTTPVYDSAKQQTKEVCNEVRTCDSFVSNSTGATSCASFTTTRLDPFTTGFYQSERDVSWKGGDFSGYTVPGMFSLDRLSQVNVAGVCSISKRACLKTGDCGNGGGVCAPNVEDADYHLARRLGEGKCSQSQNGSSCKVGYCKNNPSVLCSTSTEAEGPTDQCPGSVCTYNVVREGTCYDSQCVQLAGSAVQATDPQVSKYDVTLYQPEPLNCRAFPENDGPVPATVVTNWAKSVLVGEEYKEVLDEKNSSATVQWRPTERNPNYNGANVCQFAKTSDGKRFRTCDCRYTKANYGSGQKVLYFPAGARGKIRSSICVGGPNDGAACIPGADATSTPCGVDGRCVALNKIDQVQGAEGYCLQRDYSIPVNGDNGGFACALWLPVDSLTGSVDIYNQDENAGFVPLEDNLYYCAEGRGRSRPDGAATFLPYVNTFVDEISQASNGIICQNGPKVCSSYKTKDACNSPDNRSVLGTDTCIWRDEKCQIVIVPLPDLPPIYMPTPPKPLNFCLPGMTDATQEVIDAANAQKQVPDDYPHCANTLAGFLQSINPAGGCCFDIGGSTLDSWCKRINKNLSCTPKLCSLGQGFKMVADDAKRATMSGISGILDTVSDVTGIKICKATLPNFSVAINSCADLDKIILGSITLAVLLAPYLAYAVIGLGYISLALAPLLVGVVMAFLTAMATIAFVAFAICGVLTMQNICAILPSTDRFMFTVINSPLQGNIMGNTINLNIFAGTPIGKFFGEEGMSGRRISPRNFSFGLPSSLTGVPYHSAIIDKRPKELQRSEIAAVKITVDQAPDPQTRAVPRQFFLLPPKFEASFWWNGGDKEDKHATEDNKAVFLDRADTKCGESGMSCKDAAQNKTCEEIFSNKDNCINLMPNIGPDNTGVENCASVRPRFGRHCQNDPAFICTEDADCSNIPPCVDGPDGPSGAKVCRNDKKTLCRVGNESEDCGKAVSGAGDKVCVGTNTDFVGFVSGMCARSSTNGGQLPVKVEFLLRESCDTLVKTGYETETSSIPRSVAYTDRVWAENKASGYSFDGMPLLANNKTAATEDPFYPFGAVRLRGNDLNQTIPLYETYSGEAKGPYGYIVKAKPDEPPTKVRIATGVVNGGFAYSCSGVGDKQSPYMPPTSNPMKIVLGLGAMIANGVISLLDSVFNSAASFKLSIPFPGAPTGNTISPFGFLSNITTIGIGICSNVNSENIASVCVDKAGLGPLSCDTSSRVCSNAQHKSCTSQANCGPNEGTCNVTSPCQIITNFNQVVAMAAGTEKDTRSCDLVVPKPPIPSKFCSNNIKKSCNIDSDCGPGGGTCGTSLIHGQAAAGTLSKIFALSYGVYKWDGNTESYLEPKGCTNGICYDFTNFYNWDARNPDLQKTGGNIGNGVNAATGLDPTAQEPKVYPIQTGSCRPSDGRCFMDKTATVEKALTVNDKNGGVVEGAGSIKTTLKFYFEADKDHMPIKRLVVDWGDRKDLTDLTVSNGLYKNRVGLRTGVSGDGVAGALGCDGDQKFCSNDASKQCRDAKDCTDGATCDNSGFGRASRACEDGYMTFTHTYTCDDTTYLNGLSPVADALLKGKPVTDQTRQVCAFKPRVMVVDNWGWCNGSCTGDDVNSTICAAGLQDGNPFDQCDDAIRNEGTFNRGIKPWSHFGGTIEVGKR